MELLGSASALSVGLASATARLIGIVSEEQLLKAAREELEHTGLTDEQIEKNLALATTKCGTIPPCHGIRFPIFLPGDAGQLNAPGRRPGSRSNS